MFGSPLRTKVLLTIASLDGTYPAEIARVVGSRLLPVQRVVANLEKTGAVVTRRRGVVRVVSLNLKWYAYRELYALLLRISRDPQYREMLRIRTRPRAMDKPL